jgi:hypothetical protein
VEFVCPYFLCLINLTRLLSPRSPSPVSSPVCPLPRLRVVGVGLPLPELSSPSVPPAPLRVCRAPLVPCLIVCVSYKLSARP